MRPSRLLGLAALAVLLAACPPVDFQVDPEKFKCRWENDFDSGTDELTRTECDGLIATSACTLESYDECGDDEDCDQFCAGKDCTKSCLGSEIPTVNCSFGDVAEEVCQAKAAEFNCRRGTHIPANLAEGRLVEQCFAYGCREFTCPR
jgi:hypothetical protein